MSGKLFMLDVAVTDAVLPRTGAIVLPVPEGPPESVLAAADSLGEAAEATRRAISAVEFKGRKGQTVMIPAPADGLGRVVVVGIGKPEELTSQTAQEAGGHAAAALAREEAAAVEARGLSPAMAAEIGFGALLRSYRFDRYRTTEKAEDKPRLARLSLHVADARAVDAEWASRRAVAEGVVLARDLVTEPANVLTPATFANRCVALARLDLDVEVYGPEKMRELGFGALLGVAQGSANDPRMVVMRWTGDPEGGEPLAFIGKGVTFDTGGISIKPAQGMEEMKFDMAGAAAVAGLMAALAGRKAKVNAVGLLGLVENMPSGTAQRPGDVVTTASGQTVEVINTDAEGRLVLADVMWYCQERFAPRFMIDLATLTGAMVVALGHETCGFFSNNDELAGHIHEVGEITGERMWRMPLGDAYDRLIKSDIADMKNIGGRPGGAITAAQFLQRFTNSKTWAHLDIAGVAWATKDNAITPKGATGFGVRLLDSLVAKHYERKVSSG